MSDTDPVETLRVELAERSYDICIGPGLLAGAGAAMLPLMRRKQAIIVTDETVARHHLAPNGVVAVEMAGGVVHDEELRTARIRVHVARGAHGAGREVVRRVGFQRHAAGVVRGATGRIGDLDDVPRDGAGEGAPDVVALGHVLLHEGHGARRGAGVQEDRDRPGIGGQFDGGLRAGLDGLRGGDGARARRCRRSSSSPSRR